MYQVYPKVCLGVSRYTYVYVVLYVRLIVCTLDVEGINHRK